MAMEALTFEIFLLLGIVSLLKLCDPLLLLGITLEDFKLLTCENHRGRVSI